MFYYDKTDAKLSLDFVLLLFFSIENNSFAAVRIRREKQNSVQS